jgi:hypothetical protein
LRKCQSSRRKYHADPAAWLLPSKINAMNILVLVTADVTKCQVRSTCDSLRSSVPLTARKGPFIQQSQSSRRKYHLDPAAWVLPGEINAMSNLVHCNGGLATMLSEVNVRFIALLSPFDRTQGPIYSGKVSQVNGNITSIQRRGCFQVR